MAVNMVHILTLQRFIDKAYCELGHDCLSFLKNAGPQETSLGNTGLFPHTTMIVVEVESIRHTIKPWYRSEAHVQTLCWQLQ